MCTLLPKQPGYEASVVEAVVGGVVVMVGVVVVVVGDKTIKDVMKQPVHLQKRRKTAWYQLLAHARPVPQFFRKIVRFTLLFHV